MSESRSTARSGDAAVLTRVARRLRSYVPDLVAAGLSIAGAHFLSVAGFAVGAVLGPVYRALVAERDRRESADITEEEIAAVVQASDDLMTAGISTGFADMYDSFRKLRARVLAPAIRASRDTPDWHGREQPWRVLSAATRLWEHVPWELDAAGVEGPDSEKPSEWLTRSSVRDRLPAIDVAAFLEPGGRAVLDTIDALEIRLTRMGEDHGVT